MTDRAISTAMDVALAILLISASVAMIAYATQTDDGTVSAEKAADADYTAQTFASLTLRSTYSLETIEDDEGTAICSGDCDPELYKNELGETETYERSVHGSATTLVADAAVSTAAFPQANPEADPAPFSKAGDPYAASLDGAVKGRLTGAHNRSQVIAVWRPYESDAIEGTARFGATPPADADVSTAQLTVPSGMPSVDDDRVERAYRRNGYDGAAAVIARVIIRGYFPPEETQLALESDGLRRQYVVYRYLRAAHMYDDQALNWDPRHMFSFDAISSNDPDAKEANAELAAAMAPAIARDLESSYGTGDDAPTAENFADTVTPGQSEILIRTW